MLNTSTIGKKITKGRKKINISQSQLAAQLFISAQAVGKWERGESMPDIITFNRLAEILGVDLNYFSENFNSGTSETPVEPTVILPGELQSQKKKLSWDMSGGNWVDADFSGSDISKSHIQKSNLDNNLFRGTCLKETEFFKSYIQGCDFTDSDFGHSHIQYSYFNRNLFRDSSLKSAEFSESYINSCDFSGVNFSGASFKSGGFGNNKIANAIWNHSSFIGMQMEDVIFEGSLEECYFENCSFNWVKFQNATITSTFFKNNKFKRMRFDNCQADQITFEFLKSGKANLAGITLLAS